MKFTLMTSLLAAGMILTGCQIENSDNTTQQHTATPTQPPATQASATPTEANRPEAAQENHDDGTAPSSPTDETTHNGEDDTANNGDSLNHDHETPPTVDNGDDENGDAVNNNNDDDGSIDDITIDEGDQEPTTPAREPDGWYMRTVVKATTPEGKTYVHQTAGVFGELRESSDGDDKHDIPAFGAAALYVVFPKIKENDSLEDYFSDYHHYATEEPNDPERQTWMFQIKNEAYDDLSDATFDLSIEGPYKVYKKPNSVGYDEEVDTESDTLRQLSLVDLDTHKIYTYDEAKQKHFKMRGRKVRTFRWVLGGVQASQMRADRVQKLAEEALKKQQAQRAQAYDSMMAEGIPAKPQGGKFGLPPLP